jgi:hypothetical protein
MRISLCTISVWAAAAVTVALPAHADEKRKCAEAAELAQLRRAEGRLSEAHQELLLCAQGSCPATVSHDCDQWLAEVEASLPTIVFSAKDEAGHELTDVRVRVGPELLVDQLDGRAVDVDPGPRTFVFEHAGHRVETSLVVHEGEKNRAVSVTFPAATLPATDHAAGPAAVPWPSGAPPKSVTRVSPFAYVFAGVGVASLGVFGYFVGSAQEAFNTCSETRACTPSQVSSIAVRRDAAWAFLGAGVSSAAVAVWFFATPRVVVHPVVGGLRVVSTF